MSNSIVLQYNNLKSIIYNLKYWIREFVANTPDDLDRKNSALLEYPLSIYEWNEKTKALIKNSEYFGDFLTGEERIIKLKDFVIKDKSDVEFMAFNDFSYTDDGGVRHLGGLDLLFEVLENKASVLHKIINEQPSNFDDKKFKIIFDAKSSTAQVIFNNANFLVTGNVNARVLNFFYILWLSGDDNFKTFHDYNDYVVKNFGNEHKIISKIFNQAIRQINTVFKKNSEIKSVITLNENSSIRNLANLYKFKIEFQ